MNPLGIPEGTGGGRCCAQGIFGNLICTNEVPTDHGIVHVARATTFIAGIAYDAEHAINFHKDDRHPPPPSTWAEALDILIARFHPVSEEELRVAAAATLSLLQRLEKKQ